MKTLVTGASGFVGSHLVRRLLERGAEVRCLLRPSSPVELLAGLDVEIVRGDLRERATLDPAVAGCDRVFHCAADYRLFVRREAEMYAANVDGTRNVLAAAADAGVEKIVYTSTVGALGLRADGTPADESAPVSIEKMIGPYKRSKFLAERVAEEWAAQGLPVVVVNPSTPIGDGDIKPTATGKILVDFLNRKIPAYVDSGLNLVDVRDVAEGHVLAAERGRVGEKYILGHENLELRAIFEKLAEITGLPAPTRRVPHWLPIAAGFVDTALAKTFGYEPRVPYDAARMARYRMFFDAGKAVRELGLPQTPVDEPLRRAVDWFRAHGYVTAS